MSRCVTGSSVLDFEDASGANEFAMWDAGGHSRFILSYKRILSRPDVFPAEFVVLWRCANGLPGGRK